MMMSYRENYEKLRLRLSVEKADGTEPRQFADKHGLWAIRWNPNGERRPSFEEFCKGYGLHD